MKHRKQFQRYTTDQFYSPSHYNFKSLIFSNKQLKQKLSRLTNKTYQSKDLQVTANKVTYNYGNHKINHQTLICGKQYLKIQTNTLQASKMDEGQIDDEDRLQILRNSDKKMEGNNTQTLQIKVDEGLQFHKIGILRRLLQHYNLKGLKKKHYQRESAKNFGLRIQSMKCSQNAKDKSKTIEKNKDLILNRHRQLKSTDCKIIGPVPQKYVVVQNKKNYSEFVKQTIKYEQQEKNLQNRLTKQTLQQSTQIKKSRLIIDRPKTCRKLTQNYRQKPLKYSITDRDNFEGRLRKYKEFLFIINYSNQIYRNLQFQNYPNMVKYYIGKGNNANLIHSIMKKRFWFVQTKIESQANFVWTQIKNEQIFKRQENSKNLFKTETSDKNYKMIINRKALVTSPTKRGAKMYQPLNPILKLLNNNDYKIYSETTTYLQNIAKIDFEHKIRYIKKQLKIDLSIGNNLMHNHLRSNQLLGNKKAMFYCLREYYRLINKDIFTILPLTFHIQQGIKDQQFKKFINYFNQKKKKGNHNVWIVKPGQLTNRGNGIFCTNNLEEIKKKISIINKSIPDKRTYIIQAYITKPLLYNRRKFDIRAYMLITQNNGIMKAYWYQEGYIRTSSSIFDLDELGDPMIHLTNDAVQKYGDCYGQFQQGNKLTYKQLQRYLESIGSKFNFYEDVYPQMRKIATDSIRSSSLFLDMNKKQNNFQIFGLDFMIDDNFKVWLIQINTNPCLQLSCGILERLIPHMVQNAFRIGLDPIFPPPNNFMPSKKYNISQNALFYNKFELIYDELRDGQQLKNLYKNTKLLQLIGVVQEDKEQYDHEGQIIEIKE